MQSNGLILAPAQCSEQKFPRAVFVNKCFQRSGRELFLQKLAHIVQYPNPITVEDNRDGVTRMPQL
jgi:hypothetical protein